MNDELFERPVYKTIAPIPPITARINRKAPTPKPTKSKVLSEDDFTKNINVCFKQN